MFEAMAGLFVHSPDIHLFLNVVNGALVLHPEDAMILRLCMATFLNAALQFKNIFASNGYCDISHLLSLDLKTKLVLLF